MPRIIRNTLLKYIPTHFELESIVNPARIFELNSALIKTGSIIYLCEREIRVKDNFALQFARQQSKFLHLPLKVIHPKCNYNNLKKQSFIDKQIEQAKKIFQSSNIDFQIIDQSPKEFLQINNVAMLIIDFNPILDRSYLLNLDFKIYEIDSHNIIPARFVSNHQEYSAATFRPKIYRSIGKFVTQFDNLNNYQVEADYVLEDFIKNKLSNYLKDKNNPTKNVSSELSKYLNLGFISAQRVAIEIIKSNTSEENKEAFLEELIIRKELSDNFCLNTESFTTLSNTPNWAKQSLAYHINDIRPYIYSLAEFEYAKTHDKLWNATQQQLVYEGKIHSYLRMYWAKKILEWTSSPQEALNIAIYLNDKYAYDSPSSNGYVGILWAIGGLHDRAFADYPVTGKIRRMTYDSLKRKFNLLTYLKIY